MNDQTTNFFFFLVWYGLVWFEWLSFERFVIGFFFGDSVPKKKKRPGTVSIDQTVIQFFDKNLHSNFFFSCFLQISNSQQSLTKAEDKKKKKL